MMYIMVCSSGASELQLSRWRKLAILNIIDLLDFDLGEDAIPERDLRIHAAQNVTRS
jgi:hypothetical protein